MKNKLFSFLALIATMLFMTSCEEEVTVYKTFTISVASGDVRILDDVSNYVTTQVSDFQSSNFSGNMTESEATSVTKAFMNSLVSGISSQEYRVFEGSTLTATVKDVYNDEICTYTVTLTAYGAAATCYSYIIIKEYTPAGDLTNSDLFISGLMSDYTFTKTQAEYSADANYVVNTYTYFNYFSTLSEAKADYNSDTFADSFIDDVETIWPADVVYSGEFVAYRGYMEESTGLTGYTSNSYIRHSPSWSDNKTWSTSDSDAPFAKLEILSYKSTDAPYYVQYSISLDGDSSAGLYLIQVGYALLIVDSSYAVQYMFTLSDTSSFKLVKEGSTTVENGAVYTK